MTRTFPALINTNPDIKTVQLPSSVINKKESMSRYIVVNLQNTKDTEKILTSARQMIYKGTIIRLTAYFSTGTMEAR